MDNGTYDYTTAGLDGFLSRSIDDVNQASLNSPGPANNAIAFDRASVTGPLGDTLRLGGILIDGAGERIIMNDGNNDRLLIGKQDGGF